MNVSYPGYVGCLLTASLFAYGCGGSKETAPAATGPKAVSTSELPKLGDPLPVLDDGAIEIAPPEGWHIPGRSSKFVARFQEAASSLYPTIIITADDYDFPDVTADNVDKLAQKIGSEESLPQVKSIQVGDFVGVTYRRRAVEKDSINKILERYFLETVVAGRKYRFELRTREGLLKQTQPYLLAVVQGTKFLKAQPEPAAVVEKPTEDKPAEAAASDETPKPEGEQKPAEEKPTEEKPDEEKPKKGELNLDDLDNLDLDELLK